MWNACKTTFFLIVWSYSCTITQISCFLLLLYVVLSFKARYTWSGVGSLCWVILVTLLIDITSLLHEICATHQNSLVVWFSKKLHRLCDENNKGTCILTVIMYSSQPLNNFVLTLVFNKVERNQWFWKTQVAKACNFAGSHICTKFAIRFLRDLGASRVSISLSIPVTFSFQFKLKMFSKTTYRKSIDCNDKVHTNSVTHCGSDAQISCNSLSSPTHCLTRKVVQKLV